MSSRIKRLVAPKETWSKARRYDYALSAVFEHGWTQQEAADHYEISRSHLNVRVQEERQRREEERERLERQEAEERLSQLAREKRRIPETLTDFVETYFTNWLCPDCNVHHRVPWFHEEISEAIRGDERRILVNLGTYHSKSTVVSTWDTVMDICEDPNLRTCLVSKSGPFSESLLRQIKTILSDEDLYVDSKRNLIEDWGPFIPSQGGWSQKEIIVAGRTGAEKDPTVLAIGVGAQIYGRRFDKVKFDDVATLSNSRNPDIVASQIEWTDKEPLTRIGKSGKAIWVGTRVAPGDMYSVLRQRRGYRVISYPTLVDFDEQEVLWPEHFPFSQVLTHMDEMTPADFQLVFQQLDIPGLGAAFTQEMMDQAHDPMRHLGHSVPGWRMVAGLDPAGPTKDSGYTAFVALAVNVETGQRYVVDVFAKKSMKAFELRDKVYEWTEKYPAIQEWRVESNGLQGQIVQYNREIVQHLALRGVKVEPHATGGNKWDPQFGVESLAPLYHAGLMSHPWRGLQAQKWVGALEKELIGFPMSLKSDMVMALWFAELGARDIVQRASVPLFSGRKVPKRIKRKRRIIDFGSGTVRRPTPDEERPLAMYSNAAGARRRMRGTLGGLPEPVPEERKQRPINVDPSVWEEQVVIDGEEM